jgi:hypothetical protein
MKVPTNFNAETGEIEFVTKNRVVYDDCFQKIIPLENFYIANPYQPDIQKQPFVIWREVTDHGEAGAEFEHYKNWKLVQKGKYQLSTEPTTFYNEDHTPEIAENQVEILRYYHRRDNVHTIQVNGIVLYTGPIPFKDGKYPFAKGIFEPFDNNFFWGMSMAQKVMGEQDTQNTLINMLIDKVEGSLRPYGLSSDLDDLVEDDRLYTNKIRKVGDINKWKFDTLPGPTSGEMNMFQLMLNLGKENAGNPAGAGQAVTPRGGKMNVRQVLLQQQESQARLGFSTAFMEDFERDRITLRLSHILQFYSIPKIEKVTARNGRIIEKLLYRDISLTNTTLSDGRKGSKYIKIIGDEYKNPDMAKQMADDLSVREEMGEIQGIPTEALAISVDTFADFNHEVQVIRNSAYEKNQALERAEREEYANWRLQMAQLGAPADVPELVRWVDEAWDIDTERFVGQQGQMGTFGQSNPQMQQQGQQQNPVNELVNSQNGQLKPGLME